MTATPPLSPLAQLAFDGVLDRLVAAFRAHRHEANQSESAQGFPNCTAQCLADVAARAVAEGAGSPVEGVHPERLRAMVRLLGDQEMTPTAKRWLLALADDVCPNDTDGDGDCGRRNCPFCGER